MLKFKTTILIPALTLLLTACAGSSVIIPYPVQAERYRTALVNSDVESVSAELERKAQGADGLLYAQEYARLLQLNSQFEQSRQYFAQVYDAYAEIDDRPVVSLSEIGANTSAVLSNDNAIPYEGYGYERVLASHYQALNYLAMGDPQGASVELRRAALEQRQLELKHEEDTQQAREDAASESVDLGILQSSPEIAGMNELTGRIISSFRNPYTYYTSAIIWEAMGDYNAALVDYKKALELNPGNSIISNDIHRLETRQRQQDPGNGQLVVLFEQGFVPARESAELSFPYMTEQGPTYLNISFPFYPVNDWQQIHPLSVYIGDDVRLSTRTIAEIGVMAVKSLQEAIPGMLIRMIVRARAKHEIHQKSSEEAGAIGSILSTIYNALTEQADRRNWLSLPHNAQIARSELGAGEHSIELVVNGLSQENMIVIKPGRITVLRVVNIRNRLITQVFQL